MIFQQSKIKTQNLNFGSPLHLETPATQWTRTVPPDSTSFEIRLHTWDRWGRRSSVGEEHIYQDAHSSLDHRWNKPKCKMIAKDTSDRRVECLYQSSCFQVKLQVQNVDQTSAFKSQPNFSLKISTKFQPKNLNKFHSQRFDQRSASKSWLKFDINNPDQHSVIILELTNCAQVRQLTGIKLPSS